MEITRKQASIIARLMEEVATDLSDLSDDEIELYQEINDRYDFVDMLE